MAVSLLVIFLSACQLVGGPPQATPSEGKSETAPIALAAPSSGPDVAVTAVDFEPPLSPNANLSAGDISLLVAVENKGDRREKDLQMVAQIMGKEDELLYSDTRIVDSLAAGEGRVVQFSRLAGLPLRSVYTIKVWAIAVPGEAKLDNNAKIYRVPVTFSSP